MYKRIIMLAVAVLMVSAAACQTTGDPRQGGLFQWNEDQAQQRIDQHRQNLAALKEAGAAEQARTAQLQQERQAKSSEVARIRRDLAKLDSDIARMRRDIRRYKATTQEKIEEKARLEQRLASLKAAVDQVRQDNSMSEAEKRAEIKQLKEEIATLMEMASMLTTQ